MIDTRLLLDDFDATARRLARKGVPRDLLESARDLAERRREQQRQVEAARAEMNLGAAQVGALMREGRREDADALKASLVSREHNSRLSRTGHRPEARLGYVESPNVVHPNPARKHARP